MTYAVLVYPTAITGVSLNGINDAVFDFWTIPVWSDCPSCGPDEPLLSQSKKIIIPGTGSAEPSNLAGHRQLFGMLLGVLLKNVHISYLRNFVVVLLLVSELKSSSDSNS